MTVPIEMLERFPGLNLNSQTVDLMMLLQVPLRQYPTLLYTRACVCNSTTFFVRWELRCVTSMVIVSIRICPFHLHPCTLLLPIFFADPRGVQHASSRLGNAFSTDAHAIASVVAGWGDICASN